MIDKLSSEEHINNQAGSLILLQALNAAAASLQRSAKSEEDVYQAFREQILSLGLNGGLCILDPNRAQLKIQVVALPPTISQALGGHAAYQQLNSGSFIFSLTDVTIYQQTVEQKRPLFVNDTAAIIGQMFLHLPQNDPSQLTEILGEQSAIYAPIFIGGEVQGVINVAGPNLSEEEIPAIEAFANHLGVALENARLLSKIQQSEHRYQILAERLSSIRDIDQAILAARSPEEIGAVGLNRLEQLIPYEYASIIIYDLERQQGYILATSPASADLIGPDNEFSIDNKHQFFRELQTNRHFIPYNESAFGTASLLGSSPQNQKLGRVISIPLKSRDRLVGSLNIGKLAGDHFRSDEIDVAVEVAALLAVAIQDARYLAAEKKRRREAETLIGITAAMTSVLDRDQLLDSFLIHLASLVCYDSATIFLLEESNLRAVASRGLDNSEAILNSTYPANDPLSKDIFTKKRPIILSDAQHYPNIHGWGETDFAGGWLAVPLLVRDEAIGYLILNDRSATTYNKSEAALAQAVANQAAIIIENAHLFQETQQLLHYSRQQAAQLQQIMDLVPDGIFVLDPNHTIIIANETGRSYLAQLADATIGDTLIQFGNESIERFLTIPNSGPTWHELMSVEPRGIFEVSTRQLKVSSEPGGWLCIVRNVTDVRRHQGYLRKQERLATVGQLAAGIAHDFNNIMTVISLYTQLVLQVPELPERQIERLHIIQQEAQHASDLIRQILDFSRKTIVERKPVNLKPYLGDLIRTLGQSMPPEIQMKAQFDEGEFLTNADLPRIGQAIQNLVANARDALPSGGTVTIRLSSLSLRSNEIALLPDMKSGEWITLQVSDTGIGISARAREHIFEPFYSTKPSGKGTGLGLAQVYGIVKLHDGFIDYTSQAGVGTTFTIYLPAFVPSIRSEDLALPESAVLGDGESILIVEDDSHTRIALAEILSQLNYRVLTAANGSEALTQYERHASHIDLVISDMVMPVMDGAALYEELRKRNSNVRMIIITGYPIENSEKALLMRGVVAYLPKPLVISSVAQLVHDALKGPA